MNLDEEVVRRAEALAASSGEELDAVVERALVRHVGLAAVKRVQQRFGLDEDEALRVAYEELDAERTGG